MEVNGSKLQMHRGNFATFLAWILVVRVLKEMAFLEACVPDVQLGSKEEQEPSDHMEFNGFEDVSSSFCPFFRMIFG